MVYSRFILKFHHLVIFFHPIILAIYFLMIKFYIVYLLLQYSIPFCYFSHFLGLAGNLAVMAVGTGIHFRLVHPVMLGIQSPRLKWYPPLLDLTSVIAVKFKIGECIIQLSILETIHWTGSNLHLTLI